MNYTVIGVDLAKRVFQLHWVETETGEICRLQIKKKKSIEPLAKRDLITNNRVSRFNDLI